MDTLENQLQGNPQHCGPRTLSYTENVSAATVGYVSVLETVNSYFEFTVTALPLSTVEGSVFFTISVGLQDYPGIVYSLPVELQISCPLTHTITKSATPSFTSPFSYPLLTLPSQIEVISTISLSPVHATCSLSINMVTVIDITDPANPVVEPMITYVHASAQITILVPGASAPNLHQVTRQYVSRVIVQNAIGLQPPDDIDTFSITYSFPNGCHVTQFVPTIVSPVYVVSLDIVSQTFQVEMDTLQNQILGNPTFCGPKTLSYMVDLTQGTLPYVSITSTLNTYFELTVNSIPTNVLPSSVFLTISVELTNYPATSSHPAIQYDLPIELQLVCPLIPTLSLSSTPAFASPFIYDLSSPVSQVESVSTVTLVPPQCIYGISLDYVHDATLTAAPEVTYLQGPSQIAIQVDTTLWPSLHGVTKQYTTYIVANDLSGSALPAQSIETFQVSFSYSQASAPIDCNASTVDPSTFSANPTSYVFGEPALALDYSMNTDYYGRLYNDDAFCGLRTVKFYFSGTTNEVPWLTITQVGLGYFVNVDPQDMISDLGSHSIDIVTSLTGFASAQPNVRLWKVTIECPSDPALLVQPQITILVSMPEKLLIYQVDSDIGLESPLSHMNLEPTCFSVSKSYIVEKLTGLKVDFMTANWYTQTLFLYTRDEDKLLRATKVTYDWVVEVDPGKTSLVVDSFQVEYSATQAQRNQPYFDPELTRIIQIFKEESSSDWSFLFPQIYDAQGNIDKQIQLVVDLKKMASFVRFEDGKLVIDDLLSPIIKAGDFDISVSLVKDGVQLLERDVKVLVHNLIKDELDTELPEEERQFIAPELWQPEDDLSEIQKMVVAHRQKAMDAEAESRKMGRTKSKDAPQVRFQFISQDGDLQLSFTHDMIVVEDFRMLSEGYIVMNQKKYPVFAIDVIPNTESNPDLLKFRWEVTQWMGRTFTLKLRFMTAEAVSAQKNPDYIRLTFNDPYMFSAPNGMPVSVDSKWDRRRLQDQSIDGEDEEEKIKGEYIERALPGQIQLGGTEEQIQAILGSVLQAAEGLVYGVLVFNFLLGAALNQLWSMISMQQMMVLTPLFNIQMPANAGMYFKVIMQIAAFDFYDTTDGVQELFEVEPTDPVNPQFEAIGFESQYFLVNMGTMAVFYGIYIINLIVAIVVSPCKKTKRSGKLRRFAKRMDKKVYWGSLITLVNETFVIILIAVIINLKIFNYDTPGYRAMSILCILIFTLILAVPTLLILLLLVNFDKLEDKDYMRKYGAFYENLNLKAGRIVLLYPTWYFIRRVLLVVSILITNNTVFWQLVIIQTSTLIQVIIVGAKVHSLPSERQRDYFNETALMLLVYTLYFYTSYQTDLGFRVKLGYVTILISTLHMIISMGLIIGSSISQGKFRCKLGIIRRKYKRGRKSLQNKLVITKQKRRAARIRLRRSSMSESSMSSCSFDSVSLKSQVDQGLVSKSRINSVDSMAGFQLPSSVLGTKIDDGLNQEQNKIRKIYNQLGMSFEDEIPLEFRPLDQPKRELGLEVSDRQDQDYFGQPQMLIKTNHPYAGSSLRQDFDEYRGISLAPQQIPFVNTQQVLPLPDYRDYYTSHQLSHTVQVVPQNQFCQDQMIPDVVLESSVKVLPLQQNADRQHYRPQEEQKRASRRPLLVTSASNIFAQNIPSQSAFKKEGRDQQALFQCQQYLDQIVDPKQKDFAQLQFYNAQLENNLEEDQHDF